MIIQIQNRSFEINILLRCDIKINWKKPSLIKIVLWLSRVGIIKWRWNILVRMLNILWMENSRLWLWLNWLKLSVNWWHLLSRIERRIIASDRMIHHFGSLDHWCMIISVKIWLRIFPSLSLTSAVCTLRLCCPRSGWVACLIQTNCIGVWVWATV